MLLTLVVVLVIYGTVVRNRWGVNLSPVSCPRCMTRLPSLRDPRSIHQWMWGGWTCPVCGTGVDKWGREITPVAPRTIVRSESEMRIKFKKRLIALTPVIFCLIMLMDWLGLMGHPFPSTWTEGLVQVCANIVWTAFATLISYVIFIYPLKRSPFNVKGHGPSQPTNHT